MSFIELKEVEHSYKLGSTLVRALNGVSCGIERGEMVALAGPSGSGKTTVINLVGALDSPTGGGITVDSVDLGGLSPAERNNFRREKVSFVFQFFNLFPVLNVFENVEFPLLFGELSRDEVRRRVLTAVETVGLEGLEKRKVDGLSGGQRQRVAVARALVSRAPIVLADEPTGNLDGGNAANVMELMKEINLAAGTTFLFSTHDPRVMEYAHRVIELKDGKIENVRQNVH